MLNDNKNNLVYFESSTMKGLYEIMENWQKNYKKRLLSTNIQKDKGKFCCIALTNPTEVIIMDGNGSGAGVSSDGFLFVRDSDAILELRINNE